MAPQLPKDFISIEEAINLINSDTRTNPVVDTSFLLNNLPYLRVDGNYTIRRLKRDANGKIIHNGNVFVAVDSDYHRSILEHAIVQKYNELSGQNVDPANIGIKRLTTTVDDEQNPGGRLRANKDSKIKVGDNIVSGKVEGANA